jgi:hypothetical protein
MPRSVPGTISIYELPARNNSNGSKFLVLVCRRALLSAETRNPNKTTGEE